MWNLKKKLNTYKQRVEWWFSGAGNEGNTEELVEEYKLSILRI